MGEVHYHHAVKYDKDNKKIVILRVLDSQETHLYTEISLADISSSSRTLEVLARMLGEALILDMSQLRDELL